MNMINENSEWKTFTMWEFQQFFNFGESYKVKGSAVNLVVNCLKLIVNLRATSICHAWLQLQITMKLGLKLN